MASPVDAGRATTNSTTSGTSHNLNLPGSIAAGDFLVAVVRCPASTTIAWPAGWEEWEQSSADASDDETSIAWRIADGTEGATITITLGTSRILVGLAYRITGAVGITFSSEATGSGSQPNSGSVSFPSRDVLVLSIGGCDDSEALTSAPTNYANGTIQGSTATGASGCTVYGASRGLTAVTSEDPGAWTLGSTSIWTAWTVVLSDVTFPSRMTQEPVEVVVLPDPKGRLTQEPVEVALLPDTAKGRLTQEPVEVIVLPNTATGRLTQLPVEVLLQVVPPTEPTFQVYIID